MPLTQLVEYFNQRISDEQGLAEGPLLLREGQVESRFGGHLLASEFHPVRRASQPSMVVGHDAAIFANPPETSRNLAEKVFNAVKAGGIVNLDRLCRTIHMLNYLPVVQEESYLFLHVHPLHVLGVQRNHGAYFEEVIFRCGLSPRRVAITVSVAPLHDRHLLRLQEGLNNYQRLGYATAIRFDDRSGGTFSERYCIEFLYRITPDFVRLDKGFFDRLEAGSQDRHGSSLQSVIHGLDTEILLEGIETAKDQCEAQAIGASLVKGQYYERTFVSKTLARAG